MTRLFIILALAILLGPVAPAQGLGWIDVQKVIFEYKKTREIQDQLEKRVAAHGAEVRQEQERIKAMVESLDLPGSDDDPLDRLRNERKIRLAQVDLEIKEKNVRYQLEQDLVTHMKKVYKEVLREAEAIARDRRLTVVYMINKGDVDGRTREEVSSNILVRPILYIDPSLDLTAEVLQRLNR